jgi:hypothetical protein
MAGEGGLETTKSVSLDFSKERGQLQVEGVYQEEQGVGEVIRRVTFSSTLESGFNLMASNEFLDISLSGLALTDADGSEQIANLSTIFISRRQNEVESVTIQLKGQGAEAIVYDVACSPGSDR